jgi:hypothetical protein
MKRSVWLFGALAAGAVAGLYVFFKPPAGVEADRRAAVQPGPAQAPGAAPRMEFAFTIAAGRLASGPSLLQVRQGTEVTLRLRADRADELHLHGYDLQLAVEPEQIATLTFVADRAGRFELELHHAKLELGALEVQPH